MTRDARSVTPPETSAASRAQAMRRARGGGAPWERFGWVMAIVWLVFLIYPLITLINSPADFGWRLAGWIGLVAFVIVYVAGFINGMSFGGGGLVEPPQPIQWAAFALLIVCAVVTIPAVGGSVLSFIPFIMSFASYGLTRAAHWVTLGVCVTAVAVYVFTAPDGMRYLSVLAIIVLLGVVNTVSTTLIIQSAQGEQLGLELATSEGREAVARDVHDLVGHSLTVVSLKAQLVRRLIDTDPERAKAELADIEALTTEAIAGVRATVAGVRGATLADQLRSCRDALRAAGVSLHIDGDITALSAAQSLTAAWILREATTNVLRHANATEVTVSIAPGRFAVTDNGSGFGGEQGNGIIGMKERAAMGAGQLEVFATSAGGTRVEVTW